MVVPPHRDGGQAQYVDQPVAPSCDGTLRELLEWLRAHLDQPLTVRLLAARASMSERTFARRFVQDTGTTPQRVAYRAAHPAGPASCSKRATIRWTRSPTGPASATRPPCATTSAPGAAPPPTPTAASSAGIPEFFPR